MIPQNTVRKNKQIIQKRHKNKKMANSATRLIPYQDVSDLFAEAFFAGKDKPPVPTTA